MSDEMVTKFRSRCLESLGGRCVHSLGILGLSICAIVAAIAGYWFVSGNVMAAMGFSVIGCGISLLSAAALVLSGLWKTGRWLSCLGWVVTLFLLSPLAVCVGGIALENWREESRIERTQNSIMDLVAKVEAIRAHTGQAPLDESELMDRFGIAMPSVGRQTRLQYERDRSDPQHYRIWCILDGLSGEALEFDSRKRSQGIVLRSLF